MAKKLPFAMSGFGQTIPSGFREERVGDRVFYRKNLRLRGKVQEIVVRELRYPEEIKPYLRLAEQIWGLEKYDIPAYTDVLVLARKGGLSLGIETASGEEIGWLYVMPAIDEHQRPYHHSHMFCIAPEYQGQGLGFEIKKLYMSLALQRGIDRFTLTVDGLLFNNRLNIGKLGGVGIHFIPNLYGRMSGGLYGTTETDRLEVLTCIQTPRVQSRLQKAFITPPLEEILRDRRYQLVNEVVYVAEGLQEIRKIDLEQESSFLLMEIPGDYARTRDYLSPSGKPELMEHWRLESRRLFETYLEQKGYVVAEFLTGLWETPFGLQRRNFYLLIPSQDFDWNKPHQFPVWQKGKPHDT